MFEASDPKPEVRRAWDDPGRIQPNIRSERLEQSSTVELVGCNLRLVMFPHCNEVSSQNLSSEVHAWERLEAMKILEIRPDS